jgi:hypothetical protein
MALCFASSADVFAIENELAEQIVSQLKVQLLTKEKTAIEERPTKDLVAYGLYARAKRSSRLLFSVRLKRRAYSRPFAC